MKLVAVLTLTRIFIVRLRGNSLPLTFLPVIKLLHFIPQVVRGPKMPSTLDCKVYVGDLGSGASKQELEEAFSYYGPLRNVWVARNPPGFAFVEFEDMRDAEDAVRGLDGR